MHRKQRGFTLIELLIVIAIIGILASVVLVSLSGAREKAKAAAYKAQVHSIQAQAVLVCDSEAIVLDTNVVEPASGSWIDTMGNLTDDCGPTAGGTFTFNMESLDLGTGSVATACETVDGTVLDQNGVTFPAGC